MLIRNGVSLGANPQRVDYALSVYGNRRAPNVGEQRGFDCGSATVVNGASISDTAGRPNGYEWGNAWLLARRGGGLSSYTNFVHPNVLTASLALGAGINATLVADGSITTANLQAIANLLATMTANTSVSAAMQAFANLASTMTADTDVSATLAAFANLAATLVADGSITTADLSLVVGLACTMISDGSITTANLTLVVGLACTMIADCAVSADLKAAANMASTMLSNGDLSGALSALANLIATMTATGDISGNLRGTASMDAVMTTAGSIINPPTAAEIALAVWQYVLSGVITTATAGEMLERITLPVAIPITSAVVVADGANTQGFFKTALTESTTDYWKDALVTFATGALAGQVKKVLAYDGATKFLTVGPSPGFTGTPAPGDTFVLVNR